MKNKSFVLIGFACCVTSLVLAQSSSVTVSPGAAGFRRIESSGVFGKSVLEDCHLLLPGGTTLRPRVYCTTNALPTTITVRRATGRYLTTIQTDAQGRFRTQLNPGRYLLAPEVHITRFTPVPWGGVIRTVELKTYADPVQVVVSRGRSTPVSITYRRGLHWTLP